MDPIKGRPEWADELEYTLAYQGGELTTEQMEAVGYALSDVSPEVMWILRHTPIIGEGIGKHLRELTALYLKTSGLADYYNKPRPELSPQPTVAQPGPEDEQAPPELPVAVKQEAPEHKRAPIPEPVVVAALPTPQKTGIHGVKKAMMDVFVYVLPRKSISSFSTRGLTPLRDTHGKIVPNEYVVDKKFVQRLGEEFFKAKIQTKHALARHPGKELQGVARTLSDLLALVEKNEGKPLIFSTKGLEGANGQFTIDEKFVRRVGVQVFRAPDKTTQAYNAARDSLSPRRKAA
jgi:hypothetical protein